MLEKLLCHETWLEFLEYRTAGKFLSPGEERLLREFIENRRYLPAARRAAAGEFRFSVPEKKELNKLGTDKKRVVYCFPEEENMLLKMLSWLLHSYDGAIPDNCYSFRRDIGARGAFMKMSRAPGVDNLHAFKADVSNYFGSIDVSLLIPILGEVIDDDPPFLKLLTDLLDDDRALWRGQVIHENRGAMAGTPTSAFFANLYLRRMDEYFAERNVLYARYSDDILIFGTEDEIDNHIAAFRRFLEMYRLSSNPDKERRFAPGERWSFLGFSCQGGTIDISEAAARKIKDKIRRAAKSLRRWMIRNNAQPERALRAFNRRFNRKFFSRGADKELSWCRWYFPVINTPDTLRVIDEYMQQWQRYIVTGRHNKANYRKVPYEMLKQCGYRPLVSAYYSEK